jgi:hypothetical protein
MTKFRVIAIIVTMVAVAAIVVLLIWPLPLKQALGDEPYKVFLEFSVVTVVGGLVSAAFSELKRESESREARRHSLRSFHTTALSSYNRAKKIRRLMSALALYDVNGTRRIRKTEYHALMTELEEVQLEFESMKRQAEVAVDLFAKAPDIDGLLDTIQGYLRRPLREFEGAQFLDDDKERLSSDFPVLLTFLDDDKKADGFIRNVSAPFETLEAALLKLTLR